jgi:uncharacterized protein
MLNRLLLALCILPLFCPASDFAASAPTTQPIAWQNWSDDLFQQARRQNKFILLDLHAVWCHWCHVMDQTTYSDPAVIKLINQKYIPVGVDADARPDLANRYEDYGWPATVVFGPDGKEIVKRQGYMPPREMASMLQAIIDDPTPGPSVRPQPKITFTNQTALSDDVRNQLLARHAQTYDPHYGGWGTIHKFLDWDSVQWSMRQALAGDKLSSDKTSEHMARQTLDAGIKLIDPVWGGVDQYSTDGDWDHPHYEKIMQFQAENLRIYSLAYSQFHEPAYLKAAQQIHGYLTSFLLGSDGAFFTSQDADPVPGEQGDTYFKLSDSARRARGLPRIDRHQYARENGWAIKSLTSFYAATGDRQALDQAITAANWVIAHRAFSEGADDVGGFCHDQTNTGGPYLGDTLAMSRAFLCLYEVTANPVWLKRAADSAQFVRHHFVRPDSPGVATSDLKSAQTFAPDIELDDNVEAARWANLLAAYTGNKADHDLALAAMRYLATPQVALGRSFLVAGILLADAEVSAPPLHIVVVGPKANPDAARLFATALAIPDSYKRVEWYDKQQGSLMNMDVDYPDLPRPAAFLCANGLCSSPAYSPADLLKNWKRSIH